MPSLAYMIKVYTRADTGNKTLEIRLPESVVSTNVGEVKDVLLEFLNEHQKDAWEQMDIHFEETTSIDSLGLNLLVTVITWCEARNISINAHVHHEFIHMVLQSVWLDQKMHLISYYAPSDAS